MDIYFIGFENIHFFDFFNFIYDNSPLTSTKRPLSTCLLDERRCQGNSDKRTITATFAISFKGDFMPMQLIYGGKTTKCLPRFKFPDKFSLSYNETHYSNENEACKFIEEILQPYSNEVIERENLPVDQKSLVIMDVFKGQMTPMVLNFYKE